MRGTFSSLHHHVQTGSGTHRTDFLGGRPVSVWNWPLT